MLDFKHAQPFSPPMTDDDGRSQTDGQTGGQTGGQSGPMGPSRRTIMGGMAGIVAASLGGVVLPREVLAAAKKSPQKLVKYQATARNNRKCSDCTFFLAEDKTCKVVAGRIDPNGWCLRWAKKKS